ncbi:helix-turn-helix transcriptional regulator [Sphingoaurantiacus capsulatus]|uniref:Helix-turn-helix transcriptional regulator n=1 Tax=Sphingoaurantiacus capsulatus TaxID=1771310 RepID=A0ABV7X7D9_9SPHN
MTNASIAFAAQDVGTAFPGWMAFMPARPQAPRVPEWSGRGLAPWQLRRVADYVRANLDQPISLAALAELARLSRFHFCTAFRHATGQTPGDWVTDERIRRAAELLDQHELSITEIALEVGYETPSSFTARFRQRMGVTPSEYRRTL